MVSLIDFIVGLFRDQLDRLGVLRVTVLVFTADKGAHHRLVSELQNMTMRGDKRAPTDTGTHGPLSVSVPGRIPGGRVLDDLIDSADVLPTPAEAAGLALPDKLGRDGTSFRDRLSGKPGHPRAWLYIDYSHRPFADKLSSPYTHPKVLYVRDKRYKLYENGEFLDLRTDPTEARALAVDDPKLRPVRTRL